MHRHTQGARKGGRAVCVRAAAGQWDENEMLCVMNAV